MEQLNKYYKNSLFLIPGHESFIFYVSYELQIYIKFICINSPKNLFHMLGHFETFWTFFTSLNKRKVYTFYILFKIRDQKFKLIDKKYKKILIVVSKYKKFENVVFLWFLFPNWY